MIDINTLTQDDFKKLPLVVEGESKEVRYAGNGKVIIKFKPTIYSYTANRNAIIDESDALRLRASKVFLNIFQQGGVHHAYQEINDKWILSDLVLQPATLFNTNPFRPSDLSPEEITKLSIAPPIEVVIKRYHIGTPKHRYFKISDFFLRTNHPRFRGLSIKDESKYPETVIRFDWRNPVQNEKGERLADEVLPDQMADWYIDVTKARETAIRTYKVISDFLADKGLECWDLCLFITEDGNTVFGEISQDCGRFRKSNQESLDKDVWRAGGSSEQVLLKWKMFLDLIEK